MKRFVYIDIEALPDYFVKVLNTKKLIDSGKVNSVSEAAQINGISRSTYYKYRDSVFDTVQLPQGRKAVFLLSLSHEPGVLSQVLSLFSTLGANILTISQSLPVDRTASVMLSVDISNISLTEEEMLTRMRGMNGLKRIELLAIG